MRKTFAPAALNALPANPWDVAGQVGFVCTAQKKRNLNGRRGGPAGEVSGMARRVGQERMMSSSECERIQKRRIQKKSLTVVSGQVSVEPTCPGSPGRILEEIE